MASLLEALGHLKSMKEDTVVRVQTCIAQASRHQLNSNVRIPQLDVLKLLLDLVCSLLQKNPAAALTKVEALQARMDEIKTSPEWPASSSELLLPLHRDPAASSTISPDTVDILRLGDDEHDFLVLKAYTKVDAFALAFVPFPPSPLLSCLSQY